MPDKGHLQASKRVKEAIRRVKGEKEEEEEKRKKVSKKVIKTPGEKKTGNPGEKKAGKVAKATERKENGASLIQQSCGIVISSLPGAKQGGEDVILQKEERERKAKEAKERAAEIFKKSQAAKKIKTQKRFKRPARKELAAHNLSESDSD